MKTKHISKITQIITSHTTFWINSSLANQLPRKIQPLCPVIFPQLIQTLIFRHSTQVQSRKPLISNNQYKSMKRCTIKVISHWYVCVWSIFITRGVRRSSTNTQRIKLLRIFLNISYIMLCLIPLISAIKILTSSISRQFVLARKGCFLGFPISSKLQSLIA